MAATVANLKTRCPEFTSTATATIELAIADALLQLNISAWGDADLADIAHIYLSAHILKLWALWATAGNAPAGALKSVKDGDLSKTYGVTDASGGDASLSSTAYGREFIRLRGMAFGSRVMGSTS
jgi:hypothetical protein